MKILENCELIDILDCRHLNVSSLSISDLKMPLVVQYSEFCKGTTYHSEVRGSILHRWAGTLRATIHLISLPSPMSTLCWKCNEIGSVLLSPECILLCEDCAYKERLRRVLAKC